MSYSHLRGCWFSEMPQVRCHVHRSPVSKLRPLCFSVPSSSLSLSLLYLFMQKHAFMWLYLHPFFLDGGSSPPRCFLACIRANKVISALFIISNNRAISQVSIWTAVLYESHPVLAVRGREEARERSFNHLRALLPQREREREGRVIALKSQGPGGSEASITTLLFLKWLRCALFSASAGLTGWRSKSAIYLNQPFQNWKHE